ncbi:hypothetical protein SBF1_5620008 [Candidatus Desulfosporosinus infrequens]|uniref:Uncharacterized protein n=1 Tax=Candidatus Desulfosporosinus infrequens TaxID=2043169 RepID=A0A2U3LK59_9FIRM|nr:hypothetical protein SBF1_5620008 [Candidatus Desulfosporosinus infrequens]
MRKPVKEIENVLNNGVCVAMEQKSAIRNPSCTMLLMIKAAVPMNAGGLPPTLLAK